MKGTNMKTLTDVWYFLNGIKEQAVKVIPKDQWGDVKAACDDLFRQASGGKYKICPAWWIGGFSR
jgi:hypothetical protein